MDTTIEGLGFREIITNIMVPYSLYNYSIGLPQMDFKGNW